jgi:hypothetical protein
MDYSGTVKAFVVPPAIDPANKGKPLVDLKLAYAKAWNGDAMREYADALASASLDDIEMARPQIYYTVDNISRRLADEVFAITYGLKETSSPEALVEGILEGVSKDAEGLLSQCDRAPRNRWKLTQFSGALAYLAEISSFCSAVAESHDPSFSRLADVAGRNFARISSEAERFRAETAARYPEVADILPVPSEISAAADASLSNVDFQLPRLSATTVGRTLDAIGDVNDLWAIANGVKRKEMIASRRHQPLQEREAKELVEDVTRLMVDFDNTFNGRGFLAEMRKIAVAFRYDSLRSVDWSLKHNEASIRRDRKGIYDSAEEHQVQIEEAIARLPENRRRNQKSAAEMQTVANMLSGFLHDVGRSIRGEKPDAFVKFRKENGALVGEPDVPGSDVVVIYDDHVVRRNGNHPEAVYAVRMSADAVAAGVPPLESVRDRLFGQATNYHSLVQCLTELDNKIEQKFFFGGQRIAGHDGFTILGGATSLQDEAPSPGMRP